MEPQANAKRAQNDSLKARIATAPILIPEEMHEALANSYLSLLDARLRLELCRAMCHQGIDDERAWWQMIADELTERVSEFRAAVVKSEAQARTVCLDVIGAGTEARRSPAANRIAKRRAKRKEAGLCTLCPDSFVRPARQGRTTCWYCADQHAVHQTTWRGRQEKARSRAQRARRKRAKAATE